MSLDERREVSRKLKWEAARARVEISDPRALAVACEFKMLERSPKTWIAYLERIERLGWPGVLDSKRIAVRLFYDKMNEGPAPRNTPGFRAEQIKVIDQELAAGSAPRDIACAILRRERSQARERGAALHGQAPTLYFDRESLPRGVTLSATVPETRPYEPLFVVGAYAYAASDAIMVLPREEVRAVTNEVGTWMERNWPSAIEACDDKTDRLEGYKLDRRNVVLIAEAFVRGLMVEETAEFVFEQRVRELEVRA
jgi:hypothetical protein